jgi:hypothetical protein
MNENLDIAERYQIPLRKGVPRSRSSANTANFSTANKPENSKLCAACNPPR